MLGRFRARRRQLSVSARLHVEQMVDAWGSIPSGVLSGNAYHLGNFDECVKISEEITSSHSIHGKYCFLIVPAVSISIKIASCFPASCSAAHMDTFLEQLMQNLLNSSSTNIKFSEAICQTSESKPWDGMTIFTVVLLGLMGTNVGLCTLYDYFLRQDQSSIPVTVKICSARSSSRAIFRIIDSQSNPNVISCLDGIRCISKGKLNVPMMYLHRFIRITPILAVAILVYVNLITVVADGPLGYIEYRDKEACEKGCTNSSVQNQPSAVVGAGPAPGVVAVYHLSFLVPVFSGSE
ncbi:GL20966 [Drosophila persimilis]|uniref:GL20966 n=1 Tax=Drosophila persimilis TaxID=7234 RepID=B4HDH4_DROPE|nr:GL20966 [Drosophila persimilis]